MNGEGATNGRRDLTSRTEASAKNASGPAAGRSIGTDNAVLRMSVRQLAKQGEAVQACPMTVTELKTYRVVSDRFPAQHGDAIETFCSAAAVLVAKNIPLTLRFRARRGGAQLVARQKRFPSVAPADGDFGPDQLNIDRRVHYPACQPINPPWRCPENYYLWKLPPVASGTQ